MITKLTYKITNNTPENFMFGLFSKFVIITMLFFLSSSSSLLFYGEEHVSRISEFALCCINSKKLRPFIFS